MALKRCKVCGSSVSNKAVTCPHCGVRIDKKKIGCLGNIFLLLGIMIVIGVLTPKEKASPPASSNKPSNTNSTSYKQVDEIRDLSIEHGSIKRIVANIVIPLGRTEDEVRRTLIKAAKEISRQYNASATRVKGYRPQDDRTGQWTAGRCTYAPNGLWSEAGSSYPKKAVVELTKNSLYFQDEIKPASTQYFLYNKNGNDIKISNQRNNWMAQNIIAKIPSGTPIKIVEKYQTPLSATEMFIRYKIQVKSVGGNIEGWVHGYDVQEDKSN